MSERNTVRNHCEGNSFIVTVRLILCLVLSSRVSGIKKLPVKYLLHSTCYCTLMSVLSFLISLIIIHFVLQFNKNCLNMFVFFINFCVYVKYHHTEL